MRRVLGILALCAAIGWSAALHASSFDESLRDDVFAMVSTTQILNTIFLLDTSEGMNTFAYSGYINTCADSMQKLVKAEALCLQSWRDCQTTVDNISCGDTSQLQQDCNNLKARCDTITASKADLTTYCADVQALYVEPGQAEVQAWDNATALKYVGPWNPNRLYNLDLCFYDWTADTAFDIPNDATGSYSQYPNNPATPDGPDRRDWTCVSSAYGQVTRSGLWLNWKYTTALDAVKIIMADEHEFAIQPRHRGETFVCYQKEWLPIDPFGNDECFQSFDTIANEGVATVESTVRTKWKVDTQTEIAGITDSATCLNPSVRFKAVNPVPVPKEHDSAGCSKCYDMNGNEIACSGQTSNAFVANLDPVIADVTSSNELVCCKIFHCSTPKCRNDLYCEGDGNACPLGYYSEWDQDANHCCDTLFCAEAGGAGCATGSYIPGPGDTHTETYQDDFNMVGIVPADGEYYSLAELTTASKITLDLTARVENANLSIESGCIGELTTSEIFNQDFTTSVTDLALPNPIALLGCDDKGYRLKIILTVTHKGDINGVATAHLQFTPVLSYYKNAYFSRQVLNESAVFYRGRSWEPKGSGGPLQVVNEYECMTTFYSMKSKVVTKQSDCDKPQCDLAGGCKTYPACLADNTCYTPYTRDGVNRDPLLCKYRTLEQISGGCDGDKYTCGWVCPDAPQYDDIWKCMEYFEEVDTAVADISQSIVLVNPAGAPAAGPGENNVRCQYPLHNPPTENGHDAFQCCQNTEAFYGNYQHFSNCSSTYFKDLDTPASTGNFRCCWDTYQFSSFLDKDGATQRRITGGVEAEIVKGHIQEVGGGSYLLSGIGTNYFDGLYSTPYNSTNKWYSSKSLINYGKSTIASSFVSLFKTSEVAQRTTTCAYDIMADLYGEDCDSCGMGCCVVDMGDVDYCQFPTFWSKVAQSDGGTLVMEPKNLIGQKLVDFKDTVKNLKGVGGSALGETLYDIWRYLGGLKPAYSDLSRFPQGYASPIETDPACFHNSVIVISGGQPNFDSNSHMDGVNLNGTAPTGTQPYLQEDTADVPTSSKPYTLTNWLLSSLPKVAQFAHTQDAFIGNIACRANPATYRFGFTGACATTDTTGLNILNQIDTVGIGSWALAPLYATIGNPDETNYLDTSTLSTAATNGGGNYYSLTTETPDSNSFTNLTDLFNQFTSTHSGLRAIGRPHWTSSPIQPQGATGIADKNLAFIPAAVPVSNKVSRFWFGNLRKYFIKEKEGVDCIIGETPIPDSDSDPCTTEPIPADDFLDDCFVPASVNTVSIGTPGSTASDIEFEKVLNGGVRVKLDTQLNVCSTYPCFANTNTGRNLYYETAAKAMVDFETLDNSNTLLLTQLFGTMTADQSRKIIDYVYGYDSVDHDNDANVVEKRTGLTALTSNVGDPFDDIDTPVGWKISIPYSIMGAIVHNEPLVYFYNDYDEANMRIYVGANDGLMHAFDGLGNEKWGYMPSKIMSKMTFILSDLDTVVFNSSVDGPSSIFHIDDGAGTPANLNNGRIDTGEKAFLIFGYRRGIDISAGSSFYTVMDISDKDTPKFVQHIAVEGQSWSKPTIFRKGANYYLAFGGGYDPCYDNATPSCPSPKGAKIYVYMYNSTYSGVQDAFNHVITIERDDLDDNKKWLVAPIPAEAVAINTKAPLFYDNGSSYFGDTEHIYFVDLTGTVFRVTPGSWALKVITKLRAVPGVPGTPDFTPGLRSYHSFTFYPPTGAYPSFHINGNESDSPADSDLADQADVFITPIPISNGNKVTIKEQGLQYELITAWSMFPNEPLFATLADTSIPQYPTGFTDKTDGADSFAYTSTVRGWHLNYDATLNEKGTTAPLVLTTYQGEVKNWVTHTTYQPDSLANKCANSGSAFQYLRTVDTGIMPPGYECEKYVFTGGGIASAPRVVYGGKHADDENIVASAGANVYSIEALETAPATQTIRILKWYELY